MMPEPGEQDMPKKRSPKPRDWRSRISIKPEVCFGKPCIKGTRIWVSLILDFLANGISIEEVMEEYPQLTRQDVQACIAYGAEMARERFVPIPVEMRP
jgi:uncharacterized protein (DUF433 family)